MGRNDPCWCGSGLKWKKCHFPVKGVNKENMDNIKKRYYEEHDIIIKNKQQIEGIKKACALTAHILDETCKMAKAGVTTQELNDFAHQMHLDANAIPAPLNYGSPPFPRSICTSLNDEICHGIPNDRPLQDGDILNIDASLVLNGYYGDCSKMVCIGEISPEKQLVVDVSYQCLMRSIAVLKPGLLVSQIGEVIEDYAHAHNCSVVHQFVGHGVGLEFHEGPQVSHCRNNLHIPLVPGMTFTIEPMINAGVRDAIIDKENKWTAYTQDGKASAQWEHTVLITDTGYEILTNWTH
ncbi:MAG: methionyl aminopeptidase [Chlamydiota bacterium]|nr:methionyl aminopeptidase [Chlamydiota bacterium]